MIRSVARKAALKVPAIARLLARVHALEDQLGVVSAERDYIIAQRDSLVVERDKALADRATAITEREAAFAQRDGLVVERDKALADRATAIAERESAFAQRDDLAVERDEAIQHRAAAIAEREAAFAQRDGLAVERDEAIQHRAAAIAEREAAFAQRDGLAVERDEAIQHRAAAAAERDAALAQRDGLAVERDEAIRHRAALASELERIETEKNRIVMTVFGAGQLDREHITYNYWTAHPRYIFFKSLPPNATLLDIGAGSGGTAIWREWGNPYRHDIRLFGFDLPPDKSNHAWKSSHVDLYERFQYGNLETSPIDFDDGFFDGAMATNVLEHLNSPWNVLKALFGKLKPGGRCYIEVPTVASKNLPTAHELAARGMPVMVANFYDDNTHVEAYPLKAIADVARSMGFIVDGGGVVRQPYLEETIWQYGLDHNDPELLLYGYWSITGWIQYIILRRPHNAGTWDGSVRQLVGDPSPGSDLWA